MSKRQNEANLLSQEEIQCLIQATSRFLDFYADELSCTDEKPNVDELREMSQKLKFIADLREALFEARDVESIGIKIEMVDLV